MRRPIFAAVLAAALAACSSSSGPKPAELPKIEESAKVHRVWTASVGDGERFVFTPALVENAVFTAAPFAGDGCPTAMALADGRVIVVGRHRVFRLAADGTLYTSYGTGGSTALDGYSSTGTFSASWRRASTGPTRCATATMSTRWRWRG